MNQSIQLLAGFALLLSFGVVAAQNLAQPPAASKDEHLKFIVIISRHGVRSPTGKPEQLNQYSNQPWPRWDVPPGYLTPRGAELMTIFGAYDRSYLVQQGLFQESGCDDSTRVSIYSDSDQRTLETGKALAAGMFPGCTPPRQYTVSPGSDPLFHPLAASVGHPDHELAAASIAGRIGNDPASLNDAYRPQLALLQTILRGCQPSTPCPPESHPVAKALIDIPSSLAAGTGDHLAEIKGPLSTAATLTENLLLEYANGLPLAQVGWGHVDLPTLRQLIELHTASSDLGRRTPYLARTQASNIMNHVLLTLEQAITQKPIPGALGKPSDSALILVGHDTNLTNIAGMLNLSWLADGRRDDTPPGGALVFELWEGNGIDSVHAYYTAQTLEQMRNVTPLTIDHPPARSAIIVPGCSSTGHAHSCEWKSFQQTVHSAIDPGFLP